MNESIQTRSRLVMNDSMDRADLGARQDIQLPEDGPHTRRILSLFAQLSRIPRPSGHEDEVVAWLLDWAAERGLEACADRHRNVLIRVPASPGLASRPGIILQAHTDMVCQKREGSSHDFSCDPIVLVREGDWLTARDTTLGADNGIGVVMALAMVDDPDLAHPELELLFTSAEETDMSGAAGLSGDLLRSAELINLDSEEEGVMTLGSAGGIKSDIYRDFPQTLLEEDLAVFSLKVEGLKGGHSGLEIHRGRANANRLLAEVLADFAPLRLLSWNGGSADNVITAAAEVGLALRPAESRALEEHLSVVTQQLQQQYPGEDRLNLSLSCVGQGPACGLSTADSARLIGFLKQIPQGVTTWSADFAGLPETSCNIGIVRLSEGRLQLACFMRSFRPQALEDLNRELRDTVQAQAGEYHQRSAYPPWPPVADSALQNRFQAASRLLFDRSLKTCVLHAGLECGHLADRYPRLDIVSIGPDIEHAHSPRERLRVSSLEGVARLLGEVLSQA